MKIVLATNNLHKIREIRGILTGISAEILTLEDFPGFPQVEETGDTLEENAIIKVREINKFTGLPSLADDSGLEVDALKREPGVRSSRFAGEQCSFKDNNLKLLKLLDGTPWEQRGAKFVTVVALAKNENCIQAVKGEIRGIIDLAEKGENGFGYDPVFYVPKLKKTFAQMSPKEKNKISHRARAFKKAADLIKKGFFDD